MIIRQQRFQSLVGGAHPTKLINQVGRETGESKVRGVCKACGEGRICERGELEHATGQGQFAHQAFGID